MLRELFRGQNAIGIMAADTGGGRFSFRRLRDLEGAIGSIGEELHTEYVVNYSVTPPDPGYHRIRIELDDKRFAVRARPGYYISP